MARPSFNSQNPNSKWMSAKGIVYLYLLLLSGVFFILMMLPIETFTPAWVVTVGNFMHAVVTFFLFHWMKGSPVPTMDSENIHQTYWEQAEDGDEFSFNRKFIHTTPVLLFLMSSYVANYDATHFALNLLFLAFCIIPKIPELQGVRVFGWNKY